MAKEFKAFLLRGNLIDLAVAGPHADGHTTDSGRAKHATYTTFVA